MQDPNADTEWNDVLRQKGILPPKEEKGVTEDDLIGMLEQTIQKKSEGKTYDEMNKDELDELEDDIDEEEERLFEEYRKQRIAEMKLAQSLSRYGDVLEITKADYVSEVNKAGDGVWVVLHIFKQGIPLCTLINNHLYNLARKFPQTKFIKSVSSLCIDNYPDKNLPTIFVYFEGEMKKQWIGPMTFGGMNLKEEDLEWMLKEVGAVKSEMAENPRKAVDDVMMKAMKNNTINDSDDENDW